MAKKTTRPRRARKPEKTPVQETPRIEPPSRSAQIIGGLKTALLTARTADEEGKDAQAVRARKLTEREVQDILCACAELRLQVNALGWHLAWLTRALERQYRPRRSLVCRVGRPTLRGACAVGRCGVRGACLAGRGFAFAVRKLRAAYAARVKGAAEDEARLADRVHRAAKETKEAVRQVVANHIKQQGPDTASAM